MDSQKLERYVLRKKGAKKTLIQWLINHIQFVDKQQFSINMDKSISDMASALSERKSGETYLWFNIFSKFGSEHWLALKYSKEISRKAGKHINFLYDPKNLPTE